jgi:hypothetical protein
VVEQNTPAALSLEECKLGAVGPLKASSLKCKFPNKNKKTIRAIRKSVLGSGFPLSRQNKPEQMPSAVEKQATL